MTTATPCERCGGSGRVPRLQRRHADGSIDSLDILGRHHEVCDRCGGSGKADTHRPPPQSRSSYAADLD
jgi:DnaJ-class molecular chaperone